MARLHTSGFEVQAPSTTANYHGESDVGAITTAASGTVTLNTTAQRSGAACHAYAQGTANYEDVSSAITTLDRAYFCRAYVRFTDASPATASHVIQVRANSIVVASVRCNTSGALQLNDTAGQIGAGSAVLTDDTWYRAELKVIIPTAGAGTLELRLDGALVASSTSAAVNNSVAAAQFRFGSPSGGTAGITTYIDDVAVNDDQGAAQNTFPGSGKVVLLKPISPSANGTWVGPQTTGDDTTGLDQNVANVPPLGTSLAAGYDVDANANKFVYNITNSANQSFDVECQTYSGAGIGPTAEINVVQAFARMSVDSTTGTNTAAVEGVSNPVITAATAKNLELTGVAAAEPTGWKTFKTAPVYVPAVTTSTSPVVRATKTDASTRVTAIDLMGLLVEYRPAPATTPVNSGVWQLQWDLAGTPDGGTYTGPGLRIPPPPNTTGYTTITITSDQATSAATDPDEYAVSRLITELPSDTTDYVIDASNVVIRRPWVIRGGRNIVVIGGHSHLETPSRHFPGNDYAGGIEIGNGPASVPGRIVHIEGYWFTGKDLGDVITLSAPAADIDIRLGNIRSDAWTAPRSAASKGSNVGGDPPKTDNGVQEYQGVSHWHPDFFKANDEYKALTADRLTVSHASTGIRLDNGLASTSTIQRYNVRSIPRTSSTEGPLGTESQTYTLGSNRATFEVTQDGFTAGGATLTWPYTATVLSGTQSLHVARTNPVKLGMAVLRTSGTAMDWSGGGANAISCLVRLLSSPTEYPMMRIDVATDSAAGSTSEDGWYLGNSHRCTIGVTRRLVCNFPPAILASIFKVRILLIIDNYGSTATGESHSFIVDEVSTGTGQTNPSFTGPASTYYGGLGFYHREADAGLVYLQDCYGEPHANNEYARVSAGVSSLSKLRVWDYSINNYTYEAPAGGATIEDYVIPMAPTVGTGYVEWDATTGSKLRSVDTPTVPGSARFYQGPPPGGDFVPEGIAGLNYVNASGYDVRTSVNGGVLDLKWDVRTSVTGAALDLKWDIAAGVTGAGPVNTIVLDLRWDLGGTGVTPRYAVESPPRHLRWDILAIPAPVLPDLREAESSLAVEFSLDPSVAGFADFQEDLNEGPATAVSDTGITGDDWATPTNVNVENAVTSNASLGTVQRNYAGAAGGWVDSGNVPGVGNNTQAYATLYFKAWSNNLRADSFGFAIPSTATIQYIEFWALAMWGVPGEEGGSYMWSQVQLVKGGNPVGSAVDSGFLFYEYPVWRGWGGTPANFGGLTPAQVNSASFGFDFYAGLHTINYQTAYVDAMLMDVWYTDRSQYLKATNFGFAVPGTAKIDGIEARVRRKTTYPPAQGSFGRMENAGAYDNSVKIVKGGTITGPDKKASGQWPTTLGDKSYGGGAEKWEQSWTPADVNATDFGLAISAYWYGTAEIDYIELIVYYTEAGVSVAVSGQPKIRFGPEEADAGQVLTGTSFSTEMPGGFSAATFTLQRPEFLEPERYLYATGRLLEYETGRVLHEGRVVGISEGAEGEVGFELEGWGKSLTDNKTARAIFYDRDLSQWGDISIALKLLDIAANQKDLSTSVVPDPSTGGGALAQELSETGTVAPMLVSRAMYDAGGLKIASIDYAWKKTPTISSISGNWYANLSVGDDDIQTNYVAGSLGGAGPGAGNWDPASTTAEFAWVQFYWSQPGYSWNGTVYILYWTSLGVIGNHGLTIQGTPSVPNNPNRGILGSDVVTYVVNTWGAGVGGIVELGLIEPTTFVIPHLAFKEPTTPLQIIEAVCAFGTDTGPGAFFPLDWFVYESKQLHVANPEQHGTTWRVRYSEGVEASDAGPDVSSMLNGVMVTFDDGAGGSGSVGPPGSGADTMDATLVDLSDSNPANRDGSRHWELFSAGVTSTPGAIQIGRVILADRNRQEWRGEVTIKGTVRDSSGNPHPAALVRAGDYIVIEDDEDVRPRRIVNTTCNAAEMSVSCSIGAEPDRHDVLLAQLGVVLEGQL